jgi:hypothetical protein
MCQNVCAAKWPEKWPEKWPKKGPKNGVRLVFVLHSISIVCNVCRHPVSLEHCRIAPVVVECAESCWMNSKLTPRPCAAPQPLHEPRARVRFGRLGEHCSGTRVQADCDCAVELVSYEFLSVGHDGSRDGGL